MTLRAPFPWFGGKSRAAHLVWAAFGDVPNYVEPFAGSLAVLLARPTAPRIETVNDLDAYLANFWRSAKYSPDALADAADWPVNEADLHARHRWLVDQAEFRKRMRREPKFHDPLIAGWWVWGICQWIGGGWCASSNWDEAARRPRGNATATEERRPHLTNAGGGLNRTTDWEGRAGGGRAPRGLQTAEVEGRPHLLRGKGIHRGERSTSGEGEKRPHLAQRGGRGVHGGGVLVEKKPAIGGTRGGHGVHSAGGALVEQLPQLGGDSGAAGRGVHASGKQRETIIAWMRALAERLRRVRVCCGDWSRILGPSATEKIGVTGVLLDPPYSTEAGRDPSLYACDDGDVAHAVREWALAHGDNPKLRIALCGYEGEHEMPSTWQCVAWKANGGYAASAGNSANAHRERIWFSPACHEVVERQGRLAGIG